VQSAASDLTHRFGMLIDLLPQVTQASHHRVTPCPGDGGSHGVGHGAVPHHLGFEAVPDGVVRARIVPEPPHRKVRHLVEVVVGGQAGDVVALAR